MIWWLIRNTLLWAIGSAIVVGAFDLTFTALAIIAGFTILVAVVWVMTNNGRHQTISHIGFLVIIPAVVGINAGMLVGYLLN